MQGRVLAVRVVDKQGGTHWFCCRDEYLPDFVVYLITTPALLNQEAIRWVCTQLYKLKAEQYGTSKPGS